MSKMCKVLGYIIEVLGLIGSFALANKFGVISTEMLFSSHDERNWGLTIGIFLAGAITCSATAFILIGISIIIEKLEDIEYRIVELDRKEQKENSVSHIAETGNRFWKCPVCGKNNPQYTGTCSCGQGRP